jgi:N6-L-threonylcarbamoyladenine synthase
VVREGCTVLSNVIASQIDVHKVFGGVVPEIASRHHLTAINGIVEAALGEAGVSSKEIDAIAVTKGPGLVGAILIGLATAKAMAFATGKPLIGVHHIKGHICAALVEHPELNPPFLALVVSGGHTSLVDVRSLSGEPAELVVLGSTRDDAAGEAFDKVARMLGLGYPGGPKVDALAKEGDPHKIAFKRVMLEEGSLEFSFSGLKTGVLNYINNSKQAGITINEADIAAGFQEVVIDVLAAKTKAALEQTGRDTLALAGGVAANSALRARITKVAEEAGVRLCIPSPIYCTDNAAMIASAGFYQYKAGRIDSLDLDAFATLPL